MKLTPEEVQIMIKVRANMQAAYDNPENTEKQFICWNILRVVRESSGKPYAFGLLEHQMRAEGGVAERLYRHICWALKDLGTMRSFIEEQTAHFGYDFMLHAGNFDVEARLAWLDRIIEMEDIK